MHTIDYIDDLFINWLGAISESPRWVWRSQNPSSVVNDGEILNNCSSIPILDTESTETLILQSFAGEKAAG